MTAASPYDTADFGLDTSSLGGSLPRKLEAVRDAGFSQVMLAARDLVQHPDGVEAAARLVRSSGLRVTGLHLLQDYEGLTGPLHDHKVEIAKRLLEMCAAVGARLLCTGSTTSASAGGEPGLLARDLRKLAMLAVPMNVRIGYKPLAWGRHVRDFNAAWDVLCLADAPNLGLVIDSSHVLAARTPLSDLDWLDPSRIFLVQLADLMGQGVDEGGDPAEAARQYRVFPGEGSHSAHIADAVLRLSRLGYRGGYSFDVANDDHGQLPPSTIAQRARRSALWLAEDVLRRSTPLPGKMRLRPA